MYKSIITFFFFSFVIADPGQGSNNNHVDSVSEGLPESDTKTFYENLPFHGIQTPPNKVSQNIRWLCTNWMKKFLFFPPFQIESAPTLVIHADINNEISQLREL